MHFVIEYFAKLLKITQDHWKGHKIIVVNLLLNRIVTEFLKSSNIFFYSYEWISSDIFLLHAN